MQYLIKIDVFECFLFRNMRQTSTQLGRIHINICESECECELMENENK